MLLCRSLFISLVTTFFVCVALISVLTGCSDSSSLAKPYYHHVIATAIRLQDSYPVSTAYPGRIEAPQRFDLGFDAQGKITEVFVDAGDDIHQGQLLARLDSGLLAAQRLSVLAQEQEKNAQLKLIGIELRRQVELRQQGFAVEQTMDQLLAKQSIYQAGLDQVVATLASVDQQLEKTVMRAPFNGRIANRFVDPGQVVHLAAPVLRILKGGSVVLQVGVPVRSARQLHVGKQYRVNFEGHIFDAPILSLGSAVSPATQTVIVKLLLPDSAAGQQVYDGQIARLILDEVRHRQGFWVPTDTMTGSVRGTWNISVLQAIHETTAEQQRLYKIVRRKVNVLYAAGENSYVEGDFGSDELLLAAGVHRLAPGQRVVLGSASEASLDSLMGH